MKRTPQDLTFFKSLSETETGKYLADYIKRMIDHIHDSRSWGEQTTRTSAEDSARIVREELLEMIRPSEKSGRALNQFE